MLRYNRKRFQNPKPNCVLLYECDFSLSGKVDKQNRQTCVSERLQQIRKVSLNSLLNKEWCALNQNFLVALYFFKAKIGLRHNYKNYFCTMHFYDFETICKKRYFCSMKLSLTMSLLYVSMKTQCFQTFE